MIPESSNTVSKPTIAHLLPWPSIGGVEVATTRLIRVTADRFRHVVFCIPGSEELQQACAEAGAEVAHYIPPEPTLRHFPRFYRESRHVSDELRRQRVDLIHCSETKAAYHNSLAALIARIPLISHVRSRYSTLSLRDRLTFLPVQHYIFVSKDSRRQFALKPAERKASILYDGVDFPEPSNDVAGLRGSLGIPLSAPLVGMVARVNPQKDYDTLVDAAAEVLAQRPDVRFLVVGDNALVELNRKHYAHVQSRLQALGIEQSFLFTGFRSDISDLVSAFDIFVLCTHREGLPLAILEAMGMGKPVIATAVDGIPEVITDGVTGLLHAPGNSGELANAILRCIDDPGFAGQLAAAGRLHCRQTFSTECFAANAAALYEKLLDRQRAGSNSAGRISPEAQP